MSKALWALLVLSFSLMITTQASEEGLKYTISYCEAKRVYKKSESVNLVLKLTNISERELYLDRNIMQPGSCRTRWDGEIVIQPGNRGIVDVCQDGDFLEVVGEKSFIILPPNWAIERTLKLNLGDLDLAPGQYFLQLVFGSDWDKSYDQQNKREIEQLNPWRGKIQSNKLDLVIQ